MIDFIIGTFAFIGLGTVVFVILIWTFAYWATSSHIIGGIVKKDKNNTKRK